MPPNDHQELFTRHTANPVLTGHNLPYRANTAFNAGATMVGDETLLLLRVEDRCGMSHLTAARSLDGFNNWVVDQQPTLQASPETHPEELWGVEDPRITYLEEQKRWIIPV